MLLFTMYVKDEYTAKKMQISSKKLSQKMKKNIEMKWQWIKKGEKREIACDFHQYD